MTINRAFSVTFLVIATHFSFASNGDGDEVTKALNLPYKREFSRGAKDISISHLKQVSCIGRFASISPSESFGFSRKGISGSWLLSSFCSYDLTAFELLVWKPNSCRDACDVILDITTNTKSGSALLPGSLKSQYSDGAYSLRIEEGPQKWYLSFEQGVLINIRTRRLRQQPMTSPINQAAVIAQMDTLFDGLMSIIKDKEKKATSEELVHYKKLKEMYSAMSKVKKSNGTVVKVPNDATEFKLILLDADSQERIPTVKKPGSQEVVWKLLPQKQYLLAREDGKEIPVVKIADPKHVNEEAKIFDPNSRTSHGINDILIQAVSQGQRFLGNSVKLHAGGKYQITFWNPGMESRIPNDGMLRVFCLDKEGKVVQFGELKVDVERVEVVSPKMKSPKRK